MAKKRQGTGGCASLLTASCNQQECGLLRERGEMECTRNASYSEENQFGENRAGGK
jgi:hypothetical protein